MEGRDRSRAWAWVARSMAAGAAYDLVFALAILLFTRPAARVLRLDLPADPVYLRLNGIFLLLLAGLYLLPAFRPEQYRGVVAVAAAGRALGCVYLSWAGLAGGTMAFLALGIGDGCFAVAHTVLLMRAVRSNRASA